MPNQTANHDFGVDYQIGDDWDYNDEMQTLEERTIIRDTDGNLSDYTPHSGAMFISTDTNTFYTGDGASWSEQALGDAPTSLTNLSVSDWNYVDLVEAGADPDGNSSIVSTFDDEKGDDTLIILPPGTYLVDSPLNFEDHSNMGILGLGATITTPVSYDDDAINIDTQETDHLVKGLDFDMTSTDQGYRIMQAENGGNLHIENITVNGTYDHPSEVGILRVGIQDEEGSGVLRGLVAKDGGNGSSTYGTLMPDHVGELRVEDTHIHGYPNNGLYGGGAGKVIVNGGTYKNNGIGQVRFQGAGSVVRDADIGVDETGLNNPRGIRFRDGASLRAENCVIDMNESSSTPIDIHGNVDSAVVEDCTFALDTSTEIVVGSYSGGATNRGVTFKNVRIYGDNPATDAADTIIVNREKTSIENCHIEANDNSDGFKAGVTIQAADCSVTNSHVEAGGQTIGIDADRALVRDTDASSIEVGTPIVVDSGEGSRIINCTGTVWGNGGTDTVIRDCPDTFSGGTRTLRDGWGRNAGDPSTEGDWNGSGREGIMVRDTENDMNYVFVEGAWEQL